MNNNNSKLERYFELLNSNPNLFNNSNAPIRIITDNVDIYTWQETKKSEFIRTGKLEANFEIGIVYEDPFIILLRDLVELINVPDKPRVGFIRLLNKSELTGGMGVVILPVIEEKIIIHNHFRHATRSWHKEIIRGFGEPGTPAEIQARQEIKEEIEGEIETINDLGYLFPNTGIEGSVAKLFIAKLSKIGRLDVNEGISDLTLVSKMDFQNMIANGEINDGYTIAAYSRAQLKGFI